MSFFSKIFGQEKPASQCPRCLGKGHVNLDDIKRLKQELRWAPGHCAYCNGKGKVDPKMIDKVAAHTSYLTTDLPAEERAKLISNDKDALERGRIWDARVDNFINEIMYLHSVCNLDAGKIADFYLLHEASDLRFIDTYEIEKEKLRDYVHRVIEMKTRSGLN